MNASSQIPPTPRSLRIGRVLNELHDRRARGDAVCEEDLRREYPDFAEELIEQLALLRDIGPGKPTIDGLIRSGVLAAASDCDWRATIGEFRVFNVLGSGGMGVVLHALDPATRRPVALKLLHDSLRLDGRAAARLIREARALAAVRHDNIVNVYSVSQVSHRQVLVMEFVDGRELSRLLRDWGPAPAASARRIVLQLLDALEAAHRAGIVHRDVKPSNVLIECDASACMGGWPTDACAIRVRLTDFGLARLTTDVTRMTLQDSLLGTPEYMSPEQVAGRTDVDGRADIYAVGVVLYELLTGVVPTKASSVAATLQRILNDECKPAADIASGVDRSLSRAAEWLMQRDRNARPHSAGEAMRVLRGERRAPGSLRGRRFRAAAVLGAAALVATAPIAWRTAARPVRFASIAAANFDHKVPGRLDIVQAAAFGPSFVAATVELPGKLREVNITLVDRDGDGSKDLVVTSGRIFDATDQCITAFAADGSEVWRVGLSDQPCYDWPGETLPEGKWEVTDVQPLTLDLNGKPGEEIVLVAHAHSYRRRIISLDGTSGSILQRFTHFGSIRSIKAIPAFFADGGAALLAIGINNKLDGWDDPARVGGESWRFTDYAKVPVVFVLDPRDMDGFSPPAWASFAAEGVSDVRHVMRPARCIGYGFLNAPCDQTPYVCEGLAGELVPYERELLDFSEIEPLSLSGDGLVRLCVVRPLPDSKPPRELPVGWIDLQPRDLSIRYVNYADQLPHAERPDFTAAFVPLVRTAAARRVD